jgi:hypothetical protein
MCRCANECTRMVCRCYREELPRRKCLFYLNLPKLKNPVRLQTKRDFKHYSG